jgi:hypothetical protein
LRRRLAAIGDAKQASASERREDESLPEEVVPAGGFPRVEATTEEEEVAIRGGSSTTGATVGTGCFGWFFVD